MRGHWWTYTFQAGNINLTVDAIEVDGATNQVYEVLNRARVEQAISPISSKGDTFVFELDIQSAIEKVYANAGMKQPVFDEYFYPDVALTTVGAWQSFNCAKHTIAEHESYSFMLDGQAKDEISFGVEFVQPATHRGRSRTYSALNYLVQENVPHRMTAHFGDERRDSEHPYLVHTLDAEGKLHFLGGRVLSQNSGAAIRVAPSKLVIKIPNGFDLHSFTVDPKIGHGG